MENNSNEIKVFFVFNTISSVNLPETQKPTNQKEQISLRKVIANISNQIYEYTVPNSNHHEPSRP